MFMRNCWYVAATPVEVGRQPMARTILGEPILLFRKLDGTAVALDDRCKHRKAPLHMGKLVGDVIQCPYHGFEFAADGLCTRVPALEDAPKNLKTRSYPVVERHDWIWVWTGEPADADPALVPDFHTRADPAWTATGGMITANCSYLLFVENLMDLSHLAFVHGANIGSPDDVGARLDFERTEDFVQVIRTGAPAFTTPPMLRNLGFGPRITQKKVITFTPAGNITIDVRTTEVEEGGAERAPMRTRWMILNSLTPETETTCHYFWSHARDFALGDEGMTGVIREQTIKAFNEDRVIVEAQQQMISLTPNARMINITADWGGVQARRLVETRIEEESAGHGVAAE